MMPLTGAGRGRRSRSAQRYPRRPYRPRRGRPVLAQCSAALGAALLLPLLGTLAAGCAPKEPPRLVLLIVIDTLRADYLGCYGHPTIETPHIDRLAAEGLLYEHALTAVPVTLPAVATLLTGAYPLQHGIRDNGAYTLAEEWTTLAERFGAAGYRTGAFVSATVLARGHGLEQGFGHYDDDCSMPYEAYDPLLRAAATDHQGVERRANVTVDRAIGWLEEHDGEDSFLFVHLFDPHIPRDPPPPYRARYAGHLYAGEVAFADAEVGRLLAAARSRFGAESMTAVLTADHGEGLGDHEEELHGMLLHRETVRVPLIVSAPGVARGTRIPALVRSIDVAPTLCSLAGLEPPQRSVGRPLPSLPAIPRSRPAASPAAVEPPPVAHPTAATPARSAHLETFRPRFTHGWSELLAITTDRWKLILGPERQLYDLHRDPLERHDLAALHPARCDSLEATLRARAGHAARAGVVAAGATALSDAQAEQLASLGYVAAPTRQAPPESLAIWFFPPGERGPAAGLPHPRHELAAYQRRIRTNAFQQAGVAALAAGEHAVARRAFAQALEASPRFTPARVGLARTAWSAGDTAAALAAARAIADPPAERLELMVPLIDIHLHAGDLDRALALVDAAVAAGEETPALAERRAAIQEQAGDLDGARATLRRAVEQFVENAHLWALRALVEFDLRHFALAAQYVEQAVELDAELPLAHYLRGLIAHERGDPAEMQAAWRRYLELRPAAPERGWIEQELKDRRGEHF